MWVIFANFTAGEWVIVITAVSTLLLVPVLNYLKTRNVETKVAQVAEKQAAVEKTEKAKAETLVTQNAEVAEKLAAILDVNAAQTQQIAQVKILVNGPHRAAVRKVAELARWKADREPTEENLHAAASAAEMLRLNLLSDDN